ncbi:MAG: CheY-like chemotaxis protein [Bacteriovoracaceae bacterium]|jgi:CheY-like chemotaxis protein
MNQTVFKKSEKPTILIVEDEDPIRELIREYFERRFNCLEAKNGAIALEIIDQEKIDLIISDNDMPVLTGVELNKILNSRKQFSIPFILCSGNNLIVKESNRASLNLAAFFAKPFSLEDLALKVEELTISK